MAICEALVNSMPKRVKQCWKIMVATQIFHLGDVLTFVVSGLDINGCVELF